MSDEEYRFNQIATEIEDMKDNCQTCGGSLELVENGMLVGNYADLSYSYCERCEQFTVRFEGSNE